VPSPIAPAVGVAPDPGTVIDSTSPDDGWDEGRDEPGPAPTDADPADAVAEPHDAADDEETGEPIEVVDPSAATAGPAEPSWPVHTTWPLPTVDHRTPPSILAMVSPPDEEPDPVIVDEASARSAAAAAAAFVPARVDVPPPAVMLPDEAVPLPGSAVAAATVATAPPATPAPPTAPPAAPRASRNPLSGLADSMPDDAGTRTIVIGGGIVVLGYLLPWAGVVIGSRSLDGGLLSTWGLAGPAAPLAFLLVLVLTAIAMFHTHLPGWIGVSTPAIALAALLGGIVWPYLFGSFGAAIGVYVVAGGALLIAVGGLIDRVASRHEEPPAGV
jgi:hypothetical protein